MHFKTLLFVDVPETKQDPEWEKKVLEQMEEVKVKYPGKAVESAMLGLAIGKLTNVQTAFGYALTSVIYDAMEPFYCGTEDPKYRIFEDRTEEYMEDFNKKVLCVRMPDGKLCEANSYTFFKDYAIKDGKVYQKMAGGSLKRTRAARKIRILPEYPRSKLYSSFAEYVENEAYGCRDEKTGRYGEWYNPNGIYDWYSIGGRWPERFLVKLDCTEYSFGERSSMDETRYPAPEGYRWVACARKKDIQWQAMRDWRNQQARDRFHRLEEIFQSGKIDDTVHRITEEGLFYFGEMIYRSGQTLEDFMDKYGIPDSWKYPISVCGIFIDECYYDEHDTWYDDEQQKVVPMDWHEAMTEHIDDADDDTVFVGIDYHM